MHHAFSAQDSLNTSTLVLTDIVEDTHGNNELQQVLLIHLEACTESPPTCLVEVKGAFHHQLLPEEVSYEAHCQAVQLPPIWLHQPGLEGVIWVTDDEWGTKMSPVMKSGSLGV